MTSYVRSSQPASEWMKPADLEREEFQYQDGKILLGQTKDGRKIGIADNRHLMTIAGSRAGKTATSLIPNLLTWKGSAMVVDPKGELATITAEHRAKMGQEVIVLDPFEIVDGKASDYRKRFDPLSEVKAGNPREAVENCALIAEALITSTTGGASDHWTLSAKNLLRGLCLYALHLDLARGKPASMTQVREWVTAPYEHEDDIGDTANDLTLSTILGLMANRDEFGGAIAGVGGTMKGKPAGERGSIISTAVEQTSFLDGEAMQDHLGASDFPTLRVLKQRPTTIYLVLPASRMATHYKWLRLILTLAMSALENEPNALPLMNPTDPESQGQVLFVLEEFPQLGYMRQIEAAAGLMASYGVKLWTVLQDLTQIKSLYKESWETFIGNAGVVEAFGVNDATTLEYISKKLSMTTALQVQPDNPSLQAQQGGATVERDTIISVPLMATHEIAQGFARKKNNKLIMLAGEPPFAVRRIFWKELQGR